MGGTTANIEMEQEKVGDGVNRRVNASGPGGKSGAMQSRTASGLAGIGGTLTRRATRGDFSRGAGEVDGHAAAGSRPTRTLSTRRSSIASTSKRQPPNTMRSPSRGTRRSSANNSPASVW